VQTGPLFLFSLSRGVRMAQTIETRRLVLRPVNSLDAPDIVAGLSSLNVSKWLTQAPHPYGPADAEDFIEKNKTNFPKVAAITLDGVFAGVVGVRRELGYWLAQSFWGHGIAQEAAAAMVKDRFADPSVTELPSGHFIQNARSRNVLIKLGFADTHREEVTPLSTGVSVILQKMMLTRAALEARA